MSSFLHGLHLCHLCHLCTSVRSSLGPFRQSSRLGLILVYSLQRDVHDSLVSFFSRCVTVLFRSHSNLHWSTRVVFLVSGGRNCRDLVDDDVLQCNEKFSVRHRRSTESEVHTDFQGINLMTGSIFSSSLILPNLFSNLSVSVTNVLGMSSN